MVFTRSARVIINGDSICDPNFPYQLWLPIVTAISGYYSGTGPFAPSPPRYPPGGVCPPIFVNRAVTSEALEQTLTHIDADLACCRFTHALLGTFINDAAGITIGSYDQAHVLSNLDAMVAKYKAAGITQMLCVGPLCDGELYPSGQNNPAIGPTMDANIDALDAALAIRIPTYNGGGFTAEYVPLRGPVYATLEPQLNTAANGFADPHGLANGPLCTPLIPPSTIPGLHPNCTGRYYCNQQVWPKIVLS